MTFLLKYKFYILAFAVCALVGGWFAWGAVESHYQSRFWADREQNLKQAKDLEISAREATARANVHAKAAQAADDRAAKLAVENETLRAVNEKQAETLRESSDAAARRAGEEIEKIRKRLENDLKDIDTAPDEYQFCLACKDLAAIGKTMPGCGECLP